MSTFPETPDMFLQEANHQAVLIFSQHTPIEQIRILRQLLIDLHELHERGSRFQFHSVVEDVSFWLDLLQSKIPSSNEIQTKQSRQPETTTALKANYETIKRILLSNSVSISMRWTLYSHLAELSFNMIQTLDIVPDEDQEYLRRELKSLSTQIFLGFYFNSKSA